MRARGADLGLDGPRDVGGDHARDVAVEHGQLLDRARSKDEEFGVGGHENRLYSRIEAFVHDRELEFVGEVGHAPDSADQDFAAVAPRELHYQPIAEMDGYIGVAAQEFEEEVPALLRREEARFLAVDRDDDQKLVEEAPRAFDNVDVSERGRIEGSGKDGFDHAANLVSGGERGQ